MTKNDEPEITCEPYFQASPKVLIFIRSSTVDTVVTVDPSTALDLAEDLVETVRAADKMGQELRAEERAYRHDEPERKQDE